MNDIIEHITITCPKCFENICVSIDKSAGNDQNFIYDCEVCCRPINIKLNLKNNQVQNVDISYAN